MSKVHAPDGVVCRRDKPGNHLFREPLYRRWQVGMICSRCGRRYRPRKPVEHE